MTSSTTWLPVARLEFDDIYPLSGWLAVFDRRKVMERDELTFRNLGDSAYSAIGPSGVLGVLYWTDEQVDEENAYIWCWAPLDAPDFHTALSAPPLRRG